MLCSIGINWLFGRMIDRFGAYKKVLLLLCVIINLAILAYYKYYNFFAGSINSVVGYEILAAKEISLPIGISFFTFQALSYVIDLYRGNCKVQMNFFNLALYISFFPQLIAGPIVRYADIDQQIGSRSVLQEKFALGLRRFLYGLGKKTLFPIVWQNWLMVFLVLPLRNCLRQKRGWVQSRIQCRFIMISRDIPTWQLALAKYLVLIFRRISDIRIFPVQFMNSGRDGIFLSEAGFGSMYTFR